MSRDVVTIKITGLPCSGKTLLAKAIAEQFRYALDHLSEEWPDDRSGSFDLITLDSRKLRDALILKKGN